MSRGNKLDFITILDLEATCQAKQEDWGPGERSDIIEIGACKLDVQTGEITQKTSYIIKPQNSTVSEFCTQLTSITPEMVARGIPFENAINKFAKEFGTRNRVFASWGDYDRIQIAKDCDYYHAMYPFGRRHINVKTLFALKYKLSKEPGLKGALNICNMEFEGTHHRGCDDAYNTARLLWKVLK